MTGKPARADDYRAAGADAIVATCLYVATRLGDLMDEVCVVGGLVPTLLIDQGREDLDAETGHCGTVDLDVALALGLLEGQRYQEIAERLRDAGFTPDENRQGHATFQRWVLGGVERVTVDFLISPTNENLRGGDLHHLEDDFAAVVVPGLGLAFADREKVELSGQTILGEHATRDVWVAGPAGFIVLKALAFDRRGEPKDAYDLYYVLRNFAEGPEAVAERLVAITEVDEGLVSSALEILGRDFVDDDSVGPVRISRFISGDRNAEIEADVVGYVTRLLRLLSSG
jgi:predicted nucleotidyltransferase